MFEILPKPWESVPDNFEMLAPLIQSICFPLMPETPDVGKLYRIYPEGCVSGNGTPYHGNVRIGKDAGKLIVFLNGGGAAYNDYSVARPSNVYATKIAPTFYSNDGEWIGDYFLREGMNADRPDNPWLAWSMIHLPYCNGDFHSGDGDYEYEALDGSRQIMPFHGYRNVMAVIEMAKQWLPAPDTLVIAGSSAGGFGTAILAEDIIAAFPDCQNVTVAVDSSLLYGDWKSISGKLWQSPAHIQNRIHTDNLMLDMLTALHQHYGDAVKIGFLCSIRDALLIVAQNQLQSDEVSHSKEDGDVFARHLKAFCRALTEAVPDAALYVFTGPMDAPGYDDDELTLHCILNNPALFNYRDPVTNKTAGDWLMDLVHGTPEQVGLELLP